MTSPCSFAGVSSFGGPFKDEIHSRLRFMVRGIVAMANGGKDDNNSQFFMSLAPCDWLNGKHTIFGKVRTSSRAVEIEMPPLYLLYRC